MHRKIEDLYRDTTTTATMNLSDIEKRLISIWRENINSTCYIYVNNFAECDTLHNTRARDEQKRSVRILLAYSYYDITCRSRF